MKRLITLPVTIAMFVSVLACSQQQPEPNAVQPEADTSRARSERATTTPEPTAKPTLPRLDFQTPTVSPAYRDGRAPTPSQRERRPQLTTRRSSPANPLMLAQRTPSPSWCPKTRSSTNPLPSGRSTSSSTWGSLPSIRQTPSTFSPTPTATTGSGYRTRPKNNTKSASSEMTQCCTPTSQYATRHPSICTTKTSTTEFTTPPTISIRPPTCTTTTW